MTKKIINYRIHFQESIIDFDEFKEKDDYELIKDDFGKIFKHIHWWLKTEEERSEDSIIDEINESEGYVLIHVSGNNPPNYELKGPFSNRIKRLLGNA